MLPDQCTKIRAVHLSTNFQWKFVEKFSPRKFKRTPGIFKANLRQHKETTSVSREFAMCCQVCGAYLVRIRKDTVYNTVLRNVSVFRLVDHVVMERRVHKWSSEFAHAHTRSIWLGQIVYLWSWYIPYIIGDVIWNWSKKDCILPGVSYVIKLRDARTAHGIWCDVKRLYTPIYWTGSKYFI